MGLEINRLIRRSSITIFLVLFTVTGVFADSMAIKAINVNMPQIMIYAREPESFDQEKIKVFLNDEALKVTQVEALSHSAQGIEYYFLLDTSISIDDRHFQGMKAGLIAFVNDLSENDQVTLLTFGQDICKVYTGKAGKDFSKRVAELKNEEPQTHMFEAMVKLSNIADVNSEKRKVAVLLSDGDNIARVSNTRREAQRALKNAGITLYPLLSENVKAANESKIGEMARALGGKGYLIGKGNVKKKLNLVKHDISKELRIEATAGTNIIPTPFIITLDYDKEGFTTSKQKISPTGYQKDDTVPNIKRLERVGNSQIKIVFSEAVLGADKKENYHISLNGHDIDLLDASYSEEEHSAILKTVEPLVGGKYEVRANGVVDNSMERNALKAYSGKLKGMPYIIYAIYSILRDYWWLAVLIGLVAAVSAGTIIIKRRKGFVQIDGKLISSKNIGKRYKFHLKKESGCTVQRVISLSIDYNGSKSTELDYTIERSVIFGRGDTCEIRFDDPTMSRQHFFIELQEQNLVVGDLDTSNGTMVNGIRIHTPRKLENGDMITAGRTNMTIRWR